MQSGDSRSVETCWLSSWLAWDLTFVWCRQQSGWRRCDLAASWFHLKVFISRSRIPQPCDEVGGFVGICAEHTAQRPAIRAEIHAPHSESLHIHGKTR